MSDCPLCSNTHGFTTIIGIDTRGYKICSNCRLIFTETQFLLSNSDEKARYLTHNNGIQYPGYVNFLNQAIEPTLPYLQQNSNGLDFGCGPTPTISALLKQQGFNCDDYDPFFFPQLPNKVYDFIFATECFEHFYNPAKEIKTICNLLKPGGILTIMTEKWSTEEAFRTWYYLNDKTHVSFYHNDTFQFIAKTYGFEIIESDNLRVIILRKLG